MYRKKNDAILNIFVAEVCEPLRLLLNLKGKLELVPQEIPEDLRR